MSAVRIFWPFLLVVLATSLTGCGASKPSATISEYGRFTITGPIRTEPNRNVSGGVNIVSDDDPKLVEQTDQIPCKLAPNGFLGSDR